MFNEQIFGTNSYFSSTGVPKGLLKAIEAAFKPCISMASVLFKIIIIEDVKMFMKICYLIISMSLYKYTGTSTCWPSFFQSSRCFLAFIVSFFMPVGTYSNRVSICNIFI